MANESTPDLKAPEVQEAIKQAVAKATDGLVRKNEELLGEVKALKVAKSEVSELRAKLDEIEQDKTRKAGDFEALEKQLNEKHSRELDRLQKQVEAKDGHLRKLLIDEGLTSALAASGVAKEFLPAVKALLRDEVEIREEGEGLAAIAGGRPLPEFIKEWAGSDTGKAFVSAPDSSGGGAPGGTGSVLPKGVRTRKDLKTAVEKSAFVDKHGREAFEKLPPE